MSDQMSNKELITRYNKLQRVKPHFTVPKIKLAFNRNMNRIKKALEPFHQSVDELRQKYSVPQEEPLFGQGGSEREEIDDALYQDREELQEADAEPYNPYTVSESLLDDEAGQMSDGRVGLPDGAMTAVLWMFEE